MTGKADLSQNATFLIIPVNKLIKLIFFKSIDGIHFLPSVEFQSKRPKYLEIPSKKNMDTSIENPSNRF